MKKNLLTFLFLIAFICVGVSVASAKNSSSPGKSVVVSKKVLVAKTKAASLKIRCESSGDCAAQLRDLLFFNAIYEYWCAPSYASGCAPIAEGVLIGAGAAYEYCLNANASVLKNKDRNMVRNKTEKSRDVTSGE